MSAPMTPLEKVQTFLAAAEALGEDVLAVIDPAMKPIFVDGLNAVKTILSTSWPPDPLQSAEAVDEAARVALDAKFPGDK